DGIRDGHVTGVQTCALPISEESKGSVGIYTTLDMSPDQRKHYIDALAERHDGQSELQVDPNNSGWNDYGERSLSKAGSNPALKRSEERRVGKEGSMWVVQEE